MPLVLKTEIMMPGARTVPHISKEAGGFQHSNKTVDIKFSCHELFCGK
jgi:hypothetical protein